LVFRIRIEIQADKELGGFSQEDQIAIVRKMEAELTENPFPRAKTIKRLQGFDIAIYRLRVNAKQSYRVFYQIFEDEVIVRRIVPKKEADKVIKVLKKYLS